jgi:hypothetical protein
MVEIAQQEQNTQNGTKSNNVNTIQPKIHFNPNIINGLKYLDRFQHRLSEKSTKIANSLLNIIDSYPEQFIGVDDDSDEKIETKNQPDQPDQQQQHQRKNNEKRPQNNDKQKGEKRNSFDNDDKKDKDEQNDPEYSSDNKINSPEIHEKPNNTKTDSNKPLSPTTTTTTTTTTTPNLPFLSPQSLQAFETELNKEICNGYIFYSQLTELSSLLRELNYPNHGHHLHKLLSNSTICTHIKKKSSYDPQFAARLEFLRTKQAREMVENAIADPLGEGRGRRSDNAEENGFLSKNLQQIGAPIQFVAVSGTCAFVAYFVAGVVSEHNKGFKWAACIIGLLFGFILETSLFVVRDYRQSQSAEYKLRAEKRKDQLIMMQIKNTMFNRGGEFTKKNDQVNDVSLVDGGLQKQSQQPLLKIEPVLKTSAGKIETKKDR